MWEISTFAEAVTAATIAVQLMYFTSVQIPARGSLATPRGSLTKRILPYIDRCCDVFEALYAPCHGDEVRIPVRAPLAALPRLVLQNQKGATLHAAEGYSKPPMQLGPLNEPVTGRAG